MGRWNVAHPRGDCEERLEYRFYTLKGGRTPNEALDNVVLVFTL